LHGNKCLILVGFQGGTASDIIARLIGQWLSERLGQQFVVENRPGATDQNGFQNTPNRRSLGEP
jgi:tripartite-type tricarboxylate transporter receptor subunit TctC